MIDWVSTLLSAVRAAKLETSAEDIADALWLALRCVDLPAPAPAPLTQAPTPTAPPRSASARWREPPERTPLPVPRREYSAPAQMTVHLPQPAAEAAAGPAGQQFRSPAAPALPGTLALARALRPLMRRVPSRTRRVFDERGTVERIAAGDVWVPAMSAAPDRWLSANLILDESSSMCLWRRTARELRNLFQWLGAFRDVHVWALDTDRSPPVLRLGGIRDSMELLDPGGRALVVLFSDCVARAWYDGGIARLLDRWGRQGQTVLIQALPEHLWQRSALGAATPVRLRARAPATANSRLGVKAEHWSGDATPAVPPLPVVTLEPRPFAAWARLVAGLQDWVPGFVLDREAPAPSDPDRAGLTAEQRVADFLQIASPLARRLGQLLAAAPMVSLPVLRLVRQTLLPQAGQPHEAEVLLGGLLRITEGAAAPDPDAVLYEFHDGVRDLLLDALPSDDALTVLERVSAYLQSRLGQLPDFLALLADPAAAPGSLVAQESPFARIAADVLLRLGGDFARLVASQQPAVATQEVAPPPRPATADLASLQIARIAQDLQIRKALVEAVVEMLDYGNTVSFIARFRKERTGGLSEEHIRLIQARVQQWRQLADRKRAILKNIATQGRLTRELRDAIEKADTKRVEDLYLPFKPKKRSLAAVAREKGLEPLALAIWHSDAAVAGPLEPLFAGLVNSERQLNAADEVRLGVQHILAEMIAETADVRAVVRRVLWETGRIVAAKSDKLDEGQALEYKDYFQFTEPARQIPPHRILALNRGEKEGAIRVKMEWHTKQVQQAAERALADHLAAVAGKMPPLPVEPQPPAATEAAAPPAVFPDATEEPVGQAFLPAESGSQSAAPPVPLQGEPLSPHSEFRSPHMVFLRVALEDALNRLLMSSLEREARYELTDEAETHAVTVFALNLRSLLLQPPLRGRRVLAVDPGFRTGCKLAALDEYGNLLEHTVIYPFGGGTRETKGPREKKGAPPATLPAETPPIEPPAAEAPAAEPAAPPAPDRRSEARAKLEELIAQHSLTVIALGNGTGCRETEELIAELIATSLPDLSYVVVNEAGASVYSVSQVGREEFPNYDATTRSAISIGRRLQDPLSELVKIDPQSIGVGLYQHDMGRKELKESLEGVIESSVNLVGVDLNTASVPLLGYISGLNQVVARELVDYRKQHGPFGSREQLLQVPSLGPARFTQAAGFLRIHDAVNPLDYTWIHPESYGLAERIVGELGYGLDVLADRSWQDEFHAKLAAVNAEELARKLDAGVPTVTDIVQALLKPGRDPREDLPLPIFKKGILRLEDLQPGMELKGTVLNVVEFGAFVDIGLKDSALVHISQMGNRYIKSPYDVMAVNDVVTVYVLNVDHDRHRVSLSMIKPGAERRGPERRPPRGHGRGRAPESTHEAAAAETPPTSEATRTAEPPRPAPPPPPRKPRREPPRAKLSKEAIEGKVPLRTFGELSALFAVNRDEPHGSKSAEPAPTALPPTEAQLPVAAEQSPTEPPQQAAEPPTQSQGQEGNAGT